MRKDIFITGLRLLGIWQLVGAVNTLAYILSAWAGYIRQQSYTGEYNSVHFVVELAIGLYLIFRTHSIFNFLDRLKPEEVVAEDAGTE